MSKKHKKVCGVLNYIRHLLIIFSAVTRCVFISAFTSLVCIPVGTRFFLFIGKPFFCLSLDFLNIILEIRLRFS